MSGPIPASRTATRKASKQTAPASKPKAKKAQPVRPVEDPAPASAQRPDPSAPKAQPSAQKPAPSAQKPLPLPEPEPVAAAPQSDEGKFDDGLDVDDWSRLVDPFVCGFVPGNPDVDVCCTFIDNARQILMDPNEQDKPGWLVALRGSMQEVLSSPWGNYALGVLCKRSLEKAF